MVFPTFFQNISTAFHHAIFVLGQKLQFKNIETVGLAELNHGPIVFKSDISDYIPFRLKEIAKKTGISLWFLLQELGFLEQCFQQYFGNQILPKTKKL